MKGSRVQAIVRELGGERMDIVAWSPDPKILISRALQPAKVLDVTLRETDEKRAEVVVPDDDLLRALGHRGGQNVRLAQKLTGWQIELKTLSQVGMEQGGAQAPVIDLEDLTEELGVRTVEKLIRAGKETLQDVLRTPAEELTEIPGIGEKTATKLLAQARQLLEERAAGGSAAPAGGDEEETAAADEPAAEAGEGAAGELPGGPEMAAAEGETEEGPAGGPAESSREYGEAVDVAEGAADLPLPRSASAAAGTPMHIVPAEEGSAEPAPESSAGGPDAGSTPDALADAEPHSAPSEQDSKNPGRDAREDA